MRKTAANLAHPVFVGECHGYGGRARALYHHGDYYDINAIWQTNLISDSNLRLKVRIRRRRRPRAIRWHRDQSVEAATRL